MYSLSNHKLFTFAVFCGVIAVIACKDSSQDGISPNRVDVTTQPVIPEENVGETSGSKPNENGTMENPDFNAFKAAFRIKRSEQRDMIQKVKEMKEKKKDGALKMAIGAILKSLGKSRYILMRNNYQIGDWPEVPLNQTGDDPASIAKQDVRSALSSVVENVAFFCDLVLFFPDHVHESLRQKRDKENSPDESPSQLVKWAFTIANVEKFIFSEKDKERMKLALQELRYIPRGEDFTNPNSKEAKVEKLKLELEKKKYEEKKKRKEKEFVSEKARLKKLKYEEKIKKRKMEEL